MNSIENLSFDNSLYIDYRGLLIEKPEIAARLELIRTGEIEGCTIEAYNKGWYTYDYSNGFCINGIYRVIMASPKRPDVEKILARKSSGKLSLSLAKYIVYLEGKVK